MGISNFECDIDSFAVGIERLVGDIPAECNRSVEKVTVKATRSGVKKVKAHAGKGGLHKWSDRYVGGFKSHVDRGGGVTVGEIGNAQVPGLVHLLEKGHLTPDRKSVV